MLARRWLRLAVEDPYTVQVIALLRAGLANHNVVPAQQIPAPRLPAEPDLVVSRLEGVGPHGISVNAISPGLVDTEALHYFRRGSELLERARQLTPSGRATMVEDVANVAAFLCSESGRQVNGQIIEVDGGYMRVSL